MASSLFWILLSLALYGGVHSLLASHHVKALACRWGGAAARRLYRLFFNLFGAISFLPVLALVAALPDRPIYSVSFPWSLLFRAGQMLAVVGLAAGVLETDVWAFAGLSQAAGREDTLCSPEARRRDGSLVTGGLYRYVRHPLYFFGLVFLWLSPTLSWNTLALDLGVTAYIWIGATLEERKLLVEVGPAYEAYRKKTPMLIPGVK